MVNWYPIDTAGKIFPSVTNQANSSFFRVSVVLTEPVDADIYQRAIDTVRPRFSFLFVRLRQGTFWNYLEENNEPFFVCPETDYPCAASSFGKHDSHLIRFLYFGNRLSIEVFHAVTDGSGAVEFLKAVLFSYSVILAKEKACTVLPTPEGKIVNIQSMPTIDDYENSFMRFTRMKRKGMKIERRNHAPNSYRIKGIPFFGDRICVITGLIDASRLNSYAKQQGTTITGYLVSLLIYSLYCTRIKFCMKSKPVVVSVPVDLRKRFPSTTFRNFFVVVNVSFDFMNISEETSDSLFKTIVRSITNQLETLTGKNNLQREIDKDIIFDRNDIGRWVPLKVKHLFVKFGFRFLGEIKKTISLSNMGILDFPSETARLVDHAEAALYPTPWSPINCAVVSANGVLSISFTKSIEETDIPRSFFSLLHRQTECPVSIYANNGEVEDNSGQERRIRRGSKMKRKTERRKSKK